MKTKQILMSDIELLLHLFAPKKHELFIFDPFNKLLIDMEEENSFYDDNLPKVIINFSPDFEYYKQYSINDFDFIFDFSNAIEQPKAFKCKPFNYINNANDSMRWIYPQENRTASFLNFYNSATLKAKLYSTITSLLFKFGMTSLSKSGSFTFFYKNEIKVEKLINNISFDSYSIFTGTVGLNRKLLLELNSNGVSTHFVKIALNNNSLTLIQNEIKSLRNLAITNNEHLVFPQIYEVSDPAICIASSIKTEKVKQHASLTNVHLNALNSLYKNSLFIDSFNNSSLYGKIDNNIKILKSTSKFKETESVKEKLKLIFNSIDKRSNILFANGHVDFTPWNMYVSENKLHLYDWELSQKRVPILFDLFHFIFQSNVLLKRKGFKDIKVEIDAALNNPIIQKLIKTYDIDVNLQYKLYLLLNVSYYMNLYEKQENIHTQVFWLIKTWNEALTDITPSVTQGAQRKLFIQELFNRFSKTKYAALKFTEGNIENIQDSSDIDMLILEKDLVAVIEYFKNSIIVNKLKIHKKSFMTTVEFFFKDNTYLSIDLIYKFQRKSTTMLDNKKMLTSATKNKSGIMVPDVRFDFEYTWLFYTLNNTSVPEKYKQYFLSLSKIDISRITAYVASVYNISISNFEDVFSYSADNHKRILNTISLNSKNRGIEKFKNIFSYVVDTLKDLINRKGIMISFSGVDGAGKTTTIEKVIEVLSQKYRRKVIVLRHRPSVFPILSALKYGKVEAQKKAALTLPHSGKNSSMFLSLIRFSYYFIDYIIGQPYIYFKYILKGYVVLYDRYYFDFINDSKRSNILLPKKITKSLYRFIVKPQINVFLYASPEVILNRKQEMSKEDIIKITNSYKTLFSEYGVKYKKSKYIQLENISKEETLEKIIKEYSLAA